jgi:hypothetical protein
VKIQIETEEKIGMLACGLIGLLLGMLLVVVLHNDLLVEDGYKKYKLAYPSSTASFEDYKRLRN